MKYTFDDIIINPEDDRLEIGAEYYVSSCSPYAVLEHANGPTAESVIVLDEISEGNHCPFHGTTLDGESKEGHVLIRRKEEKPEWKPFDLSNPAVRKSLRNSWVTSSRRSGMNESVGDLVIEGSISAFEIYYDGNWYAKIAGYPVTADDLLKNWTFEDGSRCGWKI